MIQRKPINRLGLNGPSEVKNHPWLKDFPWKKLENRELKAPFLPAVTIEPARTNYLYGNFDIEQR